MKTRKFTFHISILFILSVSPLSHILAQSLYKVSFEEKIQKSTLIVEGRVIDQKSFWNPAHTMIYTSNTVEVYKEFKGGSKTVVEVMTIGGQVGNRIIKASDLLTLSPGQTGLFFLYPNRMRLQSPTSKALLLDVYSSQQGFIEYDLSNQQAATPFSRYKSIAGELYPELRKRTGRSYINKKPSFRLLSHSASAMAQAATIVSFSPATVTAGAVLDPSNNILTIDGTDFGTGDGSAAILFDNPDNGAGGTPYTVFWDDAFVISWTNTQIQLRVPTEAGTGVFQVRDAIGNITTSASPLNVLYSVFSGSVSDGVSWFAKEFRLADMNGAGGYTVQYSTNIAGSVNQTTFQRALTTWKEVCGSNLVEGPDTGIDSIDDDLLNVVMLDNANTGTAPLAAGVLGVCYSFYATCGPVTATEEILKTEFDIVLRNPGFSTGSTNFAEGPCSPNSINNGYADLETVILHELGHALNLGHIIDSYQGSNVIGEENPSKVMNYAIFAGTKRTSPDYAAKAGADYAINPRGITFGCVTEMVPLAISSEVRDNCPASFPTNHIASNTSVAFDLNHSTSNRLVDPSYTQVRCDGIGTDVTNNAYYAFRTNSTGGIISMNVGSYNTTPAAQATCTSAYGGVLVTGVRMALYEVNSCPSAQSFPTPIACRTITGNGALTDITGLASNSTYLVYLGGIDNTKANFTLTFSGSSLLPITISDFKGHVAGDHNLLNWIIDFSYDVKSIHMERSANGVNFEDLGAVTTSLVNKKGSFKDVRPLTNANYYRLATINNDGSKEYSKVILLTRKDQLLVNVFPNPAKDFVNIEINTEKPGKFNVVLYNTSGQTLYNKQVFAFLGNQVIKLPVHKFAKGQYHITIYNDHNQIVKSTTVTLQ